MSPRRWVRAALPGAAGLGSPRRGSRSLSDGSLHFAAAWNKAGFIVQKTVFT